MAIENAKMFNVRIRNKYDSYENWSNSGLILEAGEIAIAHTTVDVKVGEGTVKHPALLMKVGDGSKTFANLPWLSAKAADVLSVCKNEEDLKGFVNGVIADAGIASSEAMEALAGRVTTVENELNTATTGLKARVTTAEGAIDALEALVGDKTVGTQIQEYVAGLNLATTYEQKGEAAKVQTALNEYKTSNDAAVQKNASDIAGEISRAKAAEEANANAITAIKDGTTIDSFKDVEEALAGKEAAGAAAEALTEAKSYVDGKDSAMDARVKVVEGKAHEHSNKAELDKIVEGDKAKWDAMEQNAKNYADGKFSSLVGDKTVGEQIQETITGLDLANTYDAKGAAATVEGKLNAHISEAAAAYETKTDASGKLTEAKGYADAEVAKVQGKVDELEAYVGEIPEGYTEETVIAYINKKAAETLSAAQGGSSETAASVLQALNDYKTENNAKVKANTDAIDAIEADYLKGEDKTELQGAINTLKGLVGDSTVTEQIKAVTDPLAGRVKTIEDDYLKAADKTELQNQITANAGAIELLTNGVKADEVDGVNDLIQYVKEHGTEVTGIKADIKANSDAIDAIEKDYLKAADKTELNGLITGLDTRMGAAETAIGTKAAQSDLEALTDRVSTAEGKVSTLEGEMDTAQADILALKGLVGDEEVSTQINEAIEALKIGDYAKAADLTAAISQHNTDKAALEGEIAKKANDADLATIAKTGNVKDLIQTEGDVILFDCGNASV